MKYGNFTGHGEKYEIITPTTPSPWSNCLYNDEYYLETDQNLQGGSFLVKDYNRSECLKGYRYFYLEDRQSGEVWNPNYVPLQKTPDNYVCIHGIWMTELRSQQQGIKTTIQVMVPPAGSREIWKITLENLCDVPRDLVFYSVFGFYDHGVMGGECVYDEDCGAIVKYAFPYHIFYEEKEKVEKERACFYVFSDRKPETYEMSKRRFFGNQGERGIPEGVKNGTLSGIKGEAEEFCGAFQYHLAIEPGEKLSFVLEAGAAVTKEEIRQRKMEFHMEKVLRVMLETEEYWEHLLDSFWMETPDKNLNAFGNYWLKKQIILLTRQNRGSSYCPVRNQLQDAMGYAMIQPKEAWKYMQDVMKLQKQDGSLWQWHDTTGAPPRGLCLLNHTDGPVWLVICTEALLRQMGSRKMLEKKVSYLDGGEGTILEHMVSALLYLGEMSGEHGLCLIGDGDWNDPMNGAGREGKGESVWLSMALVYAVSLLLPYMEHESEKYGKLSRLSEKMKKAINTHTWSGQWYGAAIHDNGELMGGNDDRLFLNTQSWALMSDVANEMQRKILEDSLKKLETPFGPLILDRPFEGWDARWGRLSVKKSGTTENGSVYCHASMFLAFAYAICRNGDGLYDILWRTLPTNPENPPEKNLQLPVYLANYYYGIRESANFGRSSRHYGTGSAAWMLMLLMEELIGAKATVDGLLIRPCLPSSWRKVTAKRTCKNAVYHITIQRGKAASVRVDGRLYDKAVLPYEDGRSYQVDVTIV